MANLDDVPSRAAMVVARVINGEAVLVHPGQGIVRVLNPVGTRLWELADGQRTIRELGGTIAAEYDVTQQQAVTDVSLFCEDLARRGLLTLGSGA